MLGKEEFEVYAINVNEPYVVQKKNIQEFFKNSKEQERLSNKLNFIFPKDCFEFKKDENGFMVASINVKQED